MRRCLFTDRPWTRRLYFGRLFTGRAPRHVFLAWAGLAFLVTSCTAPQPAGPLRRVPFQPASFTGFLVPSPLLPFQARGAAQFIVRGKKESGEMLLSASSAGSYRIELLARFTGTLVLDVRFDRQRMMVVNHAAESYYLGPNTARARRELFSMDLTAEDFLILFTGRVLAERFRSGGGILTDGRATYREGMARHTFLLDKYGLPREWIKEVEGVRVFRAVFRAYMEVSSPEGISLRVPRKVRLIGGEAREGGSNGENGAGENKGPPPASMVLGIRSFTPGVELAVPPSPAELPPGVADYSPNLLPASDTGG